MGTVQESPTEIETSIGGSLSLEKTRSGDLAVNEVSLNYTRYSWSRSPEGETGWLVRIIWRLVMRFPRPSSGEKTFLVI